MALNQGLLAEFDKEMAGTRKTLERVPDDKFDWKPHAKSMTDPATRDASGPAAKLGDIDAGQSHPLTMPRREAKGTNRQF